MAPALIVGGTMALTIRTDSDFEARLDELKIRLDIKTGTGVIKHVVATYGCMADELTDTKRDLAAAKYQLNSLLDIHRRKSAVEQELVEFLEKLEILDNSFWSQNK